tara:strand:+ start:1334 stop:1786 length:453 start_codon:yes stop_codon:yes gene_type:complete
MCQPKGNFVPIGDLEEIMRKSVKTSFWGGAAIIIASLQIAHAQSIVSAACSSPTVIVTFNAAVDAVTATTDSEQTDNSALSALSFKKTAASSSEADKVALDTVGGEWSSGNTVYTVYPTLENYRDINNWDIWPLSISATASDITSSVLCQ